MYTFGAGQKEIGKHMSANQIPLWKLFLEVCSPFCCGVQLEVQQRTRGPSFMNSSSRPASSPPFSLP